MKFLICVVAVCVPSVASAQPVACTAKEGKGIVACVATAYPERLAGNVSLAERMLHMQFVRDRIIETARCAGLDVGLNLKRGGPTISNDFIAWKTGGHVEGVDIASGYDDPVPALKLQWHTYGPPDYGFPTFKPFGPVSCVIDPIPPPPPDPIPNTLVAQVAALETHMGNVRTQIGNIIAALELISSELKQHTARMDGIDTAMREIPELRSRVYKLEQIPVPLGYKCSGRIAFGIPISCSVTADVNP